MGEVGQIYIKNKYCVFVSSLNFPSNTIIAISHPLSSSLLENLVLDLTLHFPLHFLYPTTPSFPLLDKEGDYGGGWLLTDREIIFYLFFNSFNFSSIIFNTVSTFSKTSLLENLKNDIPNCSRYCCRSLS